MNKIATHDSATGERGHGLLSWLVTPFAKTQSKTIAEQYAAGCRSFDIRVRPARGRRYSYVCARGKRKGYVCAHGLWESERSAVDILGMIDRFPDRCQVCLTYEGTSENIEDFRQFAAELRQKFQWIIWGSACCKYAKYASVKVDYVSVLPAEVGYSGGVQGFLPLDGRSWQTYLPIPWLWDRLYKRPHKFNEERFTFVDFL